MSPFFTVTVSNSGFVQGRCQDFQFTAQLASRGKVKELSVYRDGACLTEIPDAMKPAYNKIGEALKELSRSM